MFSIRRYDLGWGTRTFTEWGAKGKAKFGKVSSKKWAMLICSIDYEEGEQDEEGGDASWARVINIHTGLFIKHLNKFKQILQK